MNANIATPPGINTDLERALIAACIAGDASDVHSTAGAGVTAESFADGTCATVWRALSLSVAAGEGVAIDAIARRMKGLAPVEGGVIQALRDISALQPTALRRAGLTQDVLDMARRRRLIAATGRAAREACNPALTEWEDVWGATESHLRDAMDASQGNRSRTLAEMATSARDQLLKPDLRPCISTGFAGWDQWATPCREGQLIIIAARPGGGKSAFAAQIAHHVAAKVRKQVAFFSLEMSGEEILTRMAAHRVHPAQPIDRALAHELDELAKVKTLRIFEVEHSRTLAQIESICRLLAGNPAGLGAVFVDYLQLIVPPAGGTDHREQQVAQMTRSIKLLARTIRAPVFLLSQLNRDVDKEGRKPRLSDLRESGAIEQDADRVWFLYPATPPLNAVPDPDTSTADVILLQAKCRGGPAGIDTDLMFNKRSMTFAAKPR